MRLESHVVDLSECSCVILGLFQCGRATSCWWNHLYFTLQVTDQRRRDPGCSTLRRLPWQSARTHAAVPARRYDRSGQGLSRDWLVYVLITNVASCYRSCWRWHATRWRRVNRRTSQSRWNSSLWIIPTTSRTCSCRSRDLISIWRVAYLTLSFRTITLLALLQVFAHSTTTPAQRERCDADDRCSLLHSPWFRHAARWRHRERARQGMTWLLQFIYARRYAIVLLTLSSINASKLCGINPYLCRCSHQLRTISDPFKSAEFLVAFLLMSLIFTPLCETIV